jgi:signal transduction histidine kinase
VESFPPAGCRIIISTGSDKGDIVEVSVRDFGVGLPKDRPDKIFDHFFSTKERGMGMGLTMVRSIVEAHGARLRPRTSPTAVLASWFVCPWRVGSSRVRQQHDPKNQSVPGFWRA